MERNIIIVVDDGAASVSNLWDSINADPDFEVHCAVDAPEILTIARSVRPDVILFNNQIPDLDTNDISLALKEDALLSHIPTVMITEHAGPHSPLKSVIPVADYSIARPFDAELLKARLAAIICLERYKRLLQDRNNCDWIINMLPDGVMLLDQHLKIVMINPGMVKLLGGHKPDELLGQPALSCFGPHDQKRLLEQWGSILEGRTSCDQDNTFLVTSPGESVPVEIVSGRFPGREKPGLLVIVRSRGPSQSDQNGRQESEQQYRRILDAMGDAIHVINRDYDIVFINSVFINWLTQLGLDYADIAHQKLFEFFSFLSPGVRTEYDQIFSEGITLVTEETNTINNVEHMTETRKIPLFEHHRVTGVITIIREITQRKKAESALMESEENFRILAEKSPNMIFINQNGKILYTNEQCEIQMGYSKDEFYADSFHFMDLIAPESRDLIRTNFSKHLDGQEIQPYEYVLITKAGHLIQSYITTRLIKFKGKTALLGIVTDVSELKRVQQELVESLRQKELLLREIQHRVKNNLQIITSLLRIQARKISDESLKNILRECQDRVMSLALVHDKLHLTGEQEQVNLKEYIFSLAQRLHHSFGYDTKKINLEFDLIDLYLNFDHAVPIGLILNELLSNSLKHGFPPGHSAQGTIKISLTQRNDDQFVLCIQDNGIGFDPGILGKSDSTTLGLHLIQMLTYGQLKGSLELSCDQGTCCSIIFKRSNNRAPQ